MKTIIEKTERFLEIGGIKKEITFLILSGIALLISIFDLLPLPFDAAWICNYFVWDSDYHGSNHRVDYCI